jgi:hypothetical protein
LGCFSSSCSQQATHQFFALPHQFFALPINFSLHPSIFRSTPSIFLLEGPLQVHTHFWVLYSLTTKELHLAGIEPGDHGHFLRVSRDACPNPGHASHDLFLFLFLYLHFYTTMYLEHLEVIHMAPAQG